MKQIVTLKKQRLLFTITVVLGLITTLFPTKILAQHEQVVNKTWYLNKLEIDGTIYDYLVFGISNGNESRMDVIYDNYDSTWIMMPQGLPGEDCFYLLEFTSNENSLLIYEGYCLTNYSRSHQDNNQFYLFSEKYYLFFKRPDLLLTYEIQNSDGIDYLTFTDENGDSIVYTSENLSVPDIKDLKISLVPNPARDLLVLHLDDGFSPMRMEIIDLQGRMMQQLEIHNPETQIDVSRYSAGVYLIKLTDQSGKQQTSRFVKL